MRFQTLLLENYRGFRKLELALHPAVTVLVGVNGAGKSSILAAIAAVAQAIQDDIANGTHAPNSDPGLELLSDADLHHGAQRGAVELAVAEPGDDNAHPSPRRWTLNYLRAASKTTGTGKTGVERTPDAGEYVIEHTAAPLIVHYSVERNVLDIPDRIRTKHAFDASSAHDGALQDGTSNFRDFFEWYRDEEDAYNEQRLAELDARSPVTSRLPAVRGAIEHILPGLTDLRIERRPKQRMMLTKGEHRLDVAQLSDGEKCLLALVGDLARRMVLASPPSANPLEHEAVVLIDEIELHLHPGLQRTVLPTLQSVFPKTQFVVTTHSPQVISSVHSASVRILENFALRPVLQGTFLRDTNSILGVFGDSGRPPEIQTKLNALKDAVDADDVAGARALLADLRATLEGDDPELVFQEGLLPPEGDDDSEAP